MNEKIAAWVDLEECLMRKHLLYMLNPDIFIKIFAYSTVDFLKYVAKHKELDLPMFSYYFLLQEEKESERIVNRIKKRLDWYVKIDRFDPLVKVSKRGYEILVGTTLPKKIVMEILKEVEKIYGEKINTTIIEVPSNRLEKEETIKELKKYYNLKVMPKCEAYYHFEFNFENPFLRISKSL
jgi:hypothetical protein